MDCSIPGFPVLHYLPEFAQTHVHWVSDAIQPSHPLSSPSPPTFNLSQHQGLFQWVSSLPQMAKVLEFQLQSVLLMNIQGWFPLGWTGLVSLLSKELSRVFSNTTVQKHQFFSTKHSSLVAQSVKNRPAMQENQVRSLGQEDPLEKGMATHSSLENSKGRGAWQAKSLGLQRVGHHNWAASTLTHSLLYGPALTSVHDYWKNHSFDYTDLCWQSDVSALLIHCLGFS